MGQSVNQYIKTFPDDVQMILQKVRQIIKKAAPDAEEVINYGIPTYKLNGNLVHFAGYKKHIGFYPTPPAIIHFKKELSAYNQAKGSVQFPLDKPVPYKLIEKIVRFRVEEITKKG